MHRSANITGAESPTSGSPPQIHRQTLPPRCNSPHVVVTETFHHRTSPISKFLYHPTSDTETHIYEPTTTLAATASTQAVDNELRQTESSASPSSEHDLQAISETPVTKMIKDCDTSEQPKDLVNKSVTEEMQAEAVISATTAILIEQTKYLAIHIQRPTRNRCKRNVNNIPTNTDNRAPTAKMT